MDIVTIALIIITVNMIITTLIFDYFASLVLRRFEEENEFDESVVNNFKAICDVLKIKYKTSIIESDKKESKWYYDTKRNTRR